MLLKIKGQYMLSNTFRLFTEILKCYLNYGHTMHCCTNSVPNRKLCMNKYKSSKKNAWNQC